MMFFKNKVAYPTNFELELVNFDPEKREKARRDEDELRLSRQYMINSKSLQAQHYVL